VLGVVVVVGVGVRVRVEVMTDADPESVAEHRRTDAEGPMRSI
jgi:hypothetical protein